MGCIIWGITCLRVTKSVFLVPFTCMEPLPAYFRRHLQELVNFPLMICLHNCIAGINKNSSTGLSAGEGEQGVFLSGGFGGSGSDPAAPVLQGPCCRDTSGNCLCLHVNKTCSYNNQGFVVIRAPNNTCLNSSRWLHYSVCFLVSSGNTRSATEYAQVGEDRFSLLSV